MGIEKSVSINKRNLRRFRLREAKVCSSALAARSSTYQWPKGPLRPKWGQWRHSFVSFEIWHIFSEFVTKIRIFFIENLVLLLVEVYNFHKLCFSYFSKNTDLLFTEVSICCLWRHWFFINYVFTFLEACSHEDTNLPHRSTFFPPKQTKK